MEGLSASVGFSPRLMNAITYVLRDPGRADICVIFRLDVRGCLSVYGTCRAGILRQLCDHRLRILEVQ